MYDWRKSLQTAQRSFDFEGRVARSEIDCNPPAICQIAPIIHQLIHLILYSCVKRGHGLIKFTGYMYTYLSTTFSRSRFTVISHTSQKNKNIYI